MSNQIWTIAGVAGVIAIAGSVAFVMTRSGDSNEALPDVHSGQAFASAASDGTGSDESDLMHFDTEQVAWFEELEEKLDRSQRDTLDNAKSETTRRMMILAMTFREEPEYQDRILRTFIEGVVSAPESEDDISRNSLATGMIARTWLLAGANPEYAPMFAQVALDAAATDDIATQAGCLVILEEVVGSGYVELTPEIERAFEQLQADGFNAMMAEKLRERALGGD